LHEVGGGGDGACLHGGLLQYAGGGAQ